MLETWVRCLGWEDLLEEGMAIPMDWEAWWATVHEIAESDTTEQLSTHTNLVSPHFLEMWIFWWPGSLNLALRRASATRSVLQLGADRHYDLANVDPGRCALGPSKGTAPTGLEPRLRTARQHEGPGKGCLQGPFEQPTWTTGCIYCLQALHTRPWWGKAHSRFNWLQIYGLFKKIIV